MNKIIRDYTRYLSGELIANHDLNGLRLYLQKLALLFDSCIRKLIMFAL